MLNEDWDRIAASNEVLIETRRGQRLVRTIIWVAADDGDLFVRSFLGESGRWYQRALTDPEVALVAGDTRIEFRAVLAVDTESVERASEGFRRKYRKGRSLDAMLRPEVLGTTLRLDPID